jgi:subtilisin family serine protease
MHVVHRCKEESMMIFNPRRVLAALIVSTAIVATLAAAPARAVDEYAPDIVLVKFKTDANPVWAQRLVDRYGLKLQRVLPRIGVKRFKIPRGQNPLALATFLSRYTSVVAFAEPDYMRYMRYTPNDPRFSQQWDMTRMRVPEAWDVTKGAASVVVAILDTGMDMDHPDLSGSLWRNADEIGGNNKDDDNNGYVDDEYGYDFAGNGLFPLPGAEDSWPDDTVDHGTHVSGTVAAQQDNGIGITGIAPRCKLMIVKVLGGLLGTGYTSDITEGITYAVDNGAKVINMSLGGTSKSLAEYNALKYAWQHNVFIATAAGNAGDAGNPIEYPTGYPFAMGVGATDINDVIANFSTHNGFVEVSAPGVDILSTVPDNTYDQSGWSGTSMASPHVAGVAALLCAQYPGIANWEIRAMLQDAVVDRGTPGFDPYYGYGSLKAALAVRMLRPSPAVLRILTPQFGSSLPVGTIPSVLWTPVIGATSYRLTVDLPSGLRKIITLNDTFYSVDPRTSMPLGTYHILVEALDPGGKPMSSDTVSVVRAR